MSETRRGFWQRALMWWRSLGIPAHVPPTILLPSLIAGAAFLAVNPLPTRSVSQVAAVMLMAATATIALGGRSPDARRRWGLVFSVGVLLALMYPGVAALLRIPPLSQLDRTFAMAWLGVILAVSFLILRVRGRGFDELNQVVVVIAWMLAASIWSFKWFPVVVSSHTEWASAVESMTRPTLLAHPDRPPDILHIVLDGMGRPDVVQDRFGLDLSGQVNELEGLGLNVAPDAVANYSQTYLSLASVLNMQYLDGFGQLATRPADRWPLERLIQDSGVIRSLKRIGYEVTFVGSNYSATDSFDQADLCVCAPVWFGEFEAFALLLSPLRAFPIWSGAYEAHRRKIVSSFDAVEHLPVSAQPQLLLIHVLAPHPPFVFDRHGPAPDPPRPFGFHDGKRFGGSRDAYLSGYRDQADFILTRLTAAVRQFLASRRAREVVVFVHGDHGPALDFDGEAPMDGDTDQRMTIMLATRWPWNVGRAHVKSPVNLYRTLFTEVFHQPMPALADRSFVSPFSTPYEFTEVHPKGTSAATATR